MPAQKRVSCQICNTSDSKYTCAQCSIVYCSIPCYKTHKDALTHEASAPLRPLTSLKWPYVPEESAYPDPLKRDDPKPLQLHQYEAIATSSTIRRTLAAHPQLPALLRQIDALRGPAREAALEHALGVSVDEGARAGRSEEDQKALRELAEAVEAAVRGGQEGMLGLDWGDGAV
ncbi:hypothetical protein DAEQUDRAFT_665388 [Daedalea quercina L-15889]|uniref:HIT-type domain-containing protein n=1 Tax=Daedalea quercina L-15889 TaxID=1314783 RepID=A0A165S956_9APHY|nr:hypothetical protein DAEQUDRAFT_665388 [Daedalea quercina L-15889]